MIDTAPDDTVKSASANDATPLLVVVASSPEKVTVGPPAPSVISTLSPSPPANVRPSVSRSTLIDVGGDVGVSP